MLNMCLQPGLYPGPTGGAQDAPPDPLVGWGGGCPSTHSTPLFFDKSNTDAHAYTHAHSLPSKHIITQMSMYVEKF